MKKKYVEKGHHKISSKSRRVYIAWERESESSSDESSTSSEESAQLCLIENGKKKKKVVSHYKLDTNHDLSYSQL